MENEVGDERLLECRREALDELVGQAADEADGVGDEVATSLVLEAARNRVEGLEEAVADRDVCVGQRIEERGRLPCQRDRMDTGRRAVSLQ